MGSGGRSGATGEWVPGAERSDLGLRSAWPVALGAANRLVARYR
jgi:hypothetical protein